MASNRDELDSALKALAHLDLTGRVVVDPVVKACGAFFDVYRGHLRFGANDKAVAIRRLRVFHHSDPQIGKRLTRELVIWCQLDHRNVLPLLGYLLGDTEQGFPATITEWMPNRSVREHLAAHPMAEIFPLVRGTVSGLDYLHSLDVVHADVKADNILVSTSGDALLADFGIAHLLNSTALPTTTGGIKGTARWMAYELFSCSPSQDPFSKQADIWALGMTIYEMLTRLLPYHELIRDPQVISVIQKRVLPTRPKGLECRSMLEQRLWSLCLLCWSFDPQLRPTTTQIVKILDKIEAAMKVDTLAMPNGESSNSAPAVFVRVVQTFAHNNFVHCLRFSPDGKYLAVGSENKVIIHDASSGIEINELRLEGAYKAAITALCFTPDGKLLAVTGPKLEGQICVLDVATRALHVVLAGHTKSVTELTFTPDGSALVSGSNDGTVRVWERGSDAEWVLTPGATPASSSSAVAAQLSARPAPPPSGPSTTGGAAKVIYSVAVAPDSRRIAAGAFDGTLHLWDWDRTSDAGVGPVPLTRWRAHQGSVRSVAFTPDGGGLVTGGRTLNLWDLAWLSPAAVSASPSLLPDSDLDALPGTSPPDLSAPLSSSPPGPSSLVSPPLAARTSSGLKKRRRLTRPTVFDGQTGPVVALCVSSDGGWMLSASLDGPVQLWERSSESARACWTGTTSAPNAIDFCPRGAMFATASTDGGVRLWKYTRS